MKKTLAIAICALLAATAAEAKTYYVDASRPNNNGNGLKLAAAKKTIQAAINLARDGDTVLVYPGEYFAPIKTYNRKITVKAVKGASKTTIVKPTNKHNLAMAQLGKTWTIAYTDPQGQTISFSSTPYTTGKSTTLQGFLLDGKNRAGNYEPLLALSGGSVKSCSVRRLGHGDGLETLVAVNATLLKCTVMGNHAAIADNSTFIRCRILDNEERWDDSAFYKSVLRNCLIAGNRFQGSSGYASHFATSTLVNCTIAKNRTRCGSAPFSHKSKYYNCILRNNWRGETGQTVHNTDSDNTYNWTNKTNQDPKFVDEGKGNYKLSKNSMCIDNGKVQAAIKSAVGSLDLAGAKRIRGQDIDRGCYEH